MVSFIVILTYTYIYLYTKPLRNGLERLADARKAVDDATNLARAAHPRLFHRLPATLLPWFYHHFTIVLTCYNMF